MPKAAVFLTNGFEEIEAAAPIDLLRRGNVEVDTISITGDICVTGSHNITFKADKLFDEVAVNTYDMVVLPGGPGTAGYKQHAALLSLIEKHYDAGLYVAAICAAPTVLGMLGLLKEKEAVCYPGMEGELCCKTVGSAPVVIDGNVITSRGAGTAVAFGLALVGVLMGEETAKALGEMICLT